MPLNGMLTTVLIPRIRLFTTHLKAETTPSLISTKISPAIEKTFTMPFQASVKIFLKKEATVLNTVLTPSQAFLALSVKPSQRPVKNFETG